MSIALLEQRFEARRTQMTPASKRVASYLIDNPERVLTATALEIANAAQTSTATVIRSIQQLGYAGLPELRRDLGDDLAARYDPRAALDVRVDALRRAPVTALDTVLADAGNLIAETQRVIDHDAFAVAVDILVDANRIVVLGWGSAAGTAEFTALKLQRFGYNALAETASGYRLADLLASLRQDDVVILLVPLLHTHEIDVTLEAAGAVGARCIVVTELLGERLKERADVVLNTGSSKRLAISEVVSTTVVADALTVVLSARQPELAQDRWTAINDLRQKFATEQMPSSAHLLQERVRESLPPEGD